MSFDRSVRYPTKWLPPNGSFPQGIPKNSTTETSKDGAPWEKDWISDIDAGFQGVIASAEILISGNPDTVLVSDFLTGLERLYRLVVQDITGLEGVAGLFAGEVIFLKEWRPGSGTGGGFFEWKSTFVRSNHNGGLIVSPARIYTGNITAFLSEVIDTDFGCWKRINTPFYSPEMFGAFGDKVTLDTSSVQAVINCASVFGTTIKPEAGAKYLCGHLYFYSDPANTICGGYSAKAGRVNFEGSAAGIYTGASEDQGCALIHKDGEASKFIDIKGDFTIATPGLAGGQIEFNRINIVGGDLTTDVVYMEGSQGQIAYRNLTVRGNNPAGNGVTEATTWEAMWENVLIRGDGDPENPVGWTGIGLNIIPSTDPDIADGQNNMKIYTNVNVYQWGTNIEIGRKANLKGTFAPMVFIGGQASNAENHNLILGGGVYATLWMGWQSEGARKNGVLVDRDTPVTANDLPRSNKFISCYFTSNGRVMDGSADEYQIQVRDADGVEFDTPIFNESNSGIYIDVANDAKNVAIRNPLFRTVSTYGQASGTGIFVGPAAPTDRIKLSNPTFNNNFNTNIDDVSGALTSSSVGGRLNDATTDTVVSISLGNGEFAHVLNFNKPSAVTVTDITFPLSTDWGSKVGEYNELIITFSNRNTTLEHNANIILLNDVNFTPKDAGETITFIRDGGVLKEKSRTGFGEIINTNAELNSIGNRVNTENKKAGLRVYNTTAGRPVYASGSLASSLWNYSDGSLANTPV